MTGLSRAAQISVDLRKRHHPSWTLKIKPEHYPRLYKAIDVVSHDSGGGAGHLYHLVAPSWEPHLQNLDRALSTLSADDFETFCIGEASDVEEIVRRDSALAAVSTLLNEWFDSEPEVGRAKP